MTDHLQSTPPRGDATSSPNITSGPSTPVRSATTTNANSVDYRYFNGVPGAPERKLRSRTVTQKRVQEGRELQIKSVARLIDFGGKVDEISKSQTTTTTTTPKWSRSSKSESSQPQSTSKEAARLASPIRLRERGSHSSPALKRSYSTSTSEADLVGFHAVHLMKKAKRADSIPETIRRNILSSSSTSRLNDTIMRRTSSASSRYQSNKSSSTGHRNRTIPTSLINTQYHAMQGFDPFLIKSPRLLAGSTSMTRSSSCLSQLSSSSARTSPWEDGVGDCFGPLPFLAQA